MDKAQENEIMSESHTPSSEPYRVSFTQIFRQHSALVFRSSTTDATQT